MTKEQRERLEELYTKSSWTLGELMERDYLVRLFYLTYGEALNDFINRKLN